METCSFSMPLPNSFFCVIPLYLQSVAGVPQGSVLGPTLYTLFTSDLPTSSNTTLGTFADDIAILSVHEEPDIAASNLHHHHLSAL
jgi:hypothetical protein